MPTVFFENADFSRAVNPFYTMVPRQRCRSEVMTIDRRVAVSQMTLLSVLQHLAGLGSNDSALLITHGVTNGLSLRLVPGQRSRTQCDERIVGLLTAALDGMRSRQELVPILEITELQLQQLLDACVRVRALRLRRVELRACNVGASSEFMRLFKRVLGASVLGAPRILDAYGWLEPNAPNPDPQRMARFEADHDNERVYDVGVGRVGVAAERSELRRGRVTMLGTSEAAIIEWARRFLALDQGFGTWTNWRRFPYHGFFRFSQREPMVWHGSPGYVEQLVEV